MPLPLPTSESWFFELLFPGAIAALLAYPLLPSWAQPGSVPSNYVGFIGFSLLIGLLPRVFLMQLAGLSMGQYWPKPIRDWAIGNLQRRLDRFAQTTTDNAQRQSTSVTDTNAPLWMLAGAARQLGQQRLPEMFLSNAQGRKIAVCPTLYGNALLSGLWEAVGFFIAKHVLVLGAKNIDANTLKSMVVQAVYAIPGDVRREIQDRDAFGAGLQRMSVLAMSAAICDVVNALLTNMDVAHKIGLAALALIVAQVTYSIGLSELVNSFINIRALVLRLDGQEIERLRLNIQALAAKPGTAEQAATQDKAATLTSQGVSAATLPTPKETSTQG